MPYLFVIFLFILLAVPLFINAYHKRMEKQYQKKQYSDASLFQHVIKNMDQLHQKDAISTYGLEPYQSLLHSIQDHTDLPITKNDRVHILKNGDETYPALKKEIEEAKHHIHLLFYTFRDDQIGQEFEQLLIKKAEQGVHVRLLVDGVGSKASQQALQSRFQQSGIKYAVFAPVRLPFLLHIQYRNHRKIAVIDGRVGLTGGLNIGDEYLHRDPKKGFWRDVHLLMEGEAVLLLQKIFATDWYYATQQMIKDDQDYFPRHTRKETYQDGEETALAQVLPSGPDMEADVIQHVYQALLASAQKRIWLSTPYFVPDQSFINALIEARKRGVEVCLLVPKKTDNILVQAASFHFYKILVAYGIRIYQYKKGFYHAKMALIDDRVSKIGSANFDRRSFHYSFEAGVFLYHRETCLQLRKLFEEDFRDSELLQQKQVQNRTLWQRIATQLSLLLAPWL